MSERIEIVLEGCAPREEIRTYRHLPFDVPANASRIDVRYRFDEAASIIDIGIFDPRGVAYPGTGYRGWSGSARREFFITPREATPAYMPGPLPPGQWHICLGLYEIAEGGCDYQITITLHVEPAPVAAADFPPLLALSAEPRPGQRRESGWYKGELHCHTFNSDGDSSVEDVVRHAESLGLDFLAITDHNVLSHLAQMHEVAARLMLIPGCEVTTYQGHWNIWAVDGWIDFRVLSEADMRRSMEEALRRGYLVSCNHPRPHGPEWAYPDLETFHCVEVWNGPWELLNDVCLAFWERHLQAGRRFTAVGGSDNHFLRRAHIAHLGTPTTWIYCVGDPSPAKLLDGLRAGHAFISEAPTGPQLYLRSGRAMMGDTLAVSPGQPLNLDLLVLNGRQLTLELHTAQGILRRYAIDSDPWRVQGVIEWDTEALYVRAQLVSGSAGRRRVHALTNPIYCQSHA